MSSGLSGYLVFVRCTMDDFPVMFFANRKEALFHAKSLVVSGCDCLPSQEIQDIFTICATEPFCVDVYRFIKGFPKQRIERIDLP